VSGETSEERMRKAMGDGNCHHLNREKRFVGRKPLGPRCFIVLGSTWSLATRAVKKPHGGPQGSNMAP
jgi:hypothetical protein